MSKIQAMFSAKGRRLFDSEKQDIDDFNREFASAAGPDVVVQRRPVEERRLRNSNGGQFIKQERRGNGGVVAVVQIGGNVREVKAVLGKKPVPAKIVTYKDAKFGTFVKLLPRRRDKREPDFGQPMGEPRATQ